MNYPLLNLNMPVRVDGSSGPLTVSCHLCNKEWLFNFKDVKAQEWLADCDCQGRKYSFSPDRAKKNDKIYSGFKEVEA